MRNSTLLDIGGIKEDIFGAINYFVKSISKNKLSGYVTKVDGNIIYF